MIKNVMAANEQDFANLYSLQLFSEEEETEETTEDVEETNETDTEETETEETEEVANSEEETEESKEDITQTQAFSKRLKEETERVRKESSTTAVDNYIKEQYEGQEWNGKPITTQAELTQALYEQEMQNSGQDQEAIQRLVDEHPDMKAYRESKKANEANEKMYSEWLELTEEYKDIKEFSQIPQETYDMAKSKGIPLLDAYNRSNMKKIKLQTEQETIRNINKNATSSPGSASNGGVVHKTKSVSDMTSKEFESYRDEVSKQRKEFD